MTIRLLSAYGIYPINAIVTLDAGTEAGLVAANQASTNLTGGTTYVPPTQPNQKRAATLVLDAAGNVLGLEGPNDTIISLGGGSGGTVPGQPAKPTATAGVNAFSLAWAAPAAGSSPILQTQFTDKNGATTDLVSNPQTIAATANVSTYGTVRSRNAQGWGPYSLACDPVTPTAPVAASLSRLLNGATLNSTTLN